jgi:hypothetical protein
MKVYVLYAACSQSVYKIAQARREPEFRGHGTIDALATQDERPKKRLETKEQHRHPPCAEHGGLIGHMPVDAASSAVRNQHSHRNARRRVTFQRSSGPGLLKSVPASPSPFRPPQDGRYKPVIDPFPRHPSER